MSIIIPWYRIYNNSDRLIRPGDYHWCIGGLTYSAPADSKLHIQWNQNPLSQQIAAYHYLSSRINLSLHPQQLDTLYHDLTRTERYSDYIHYPNYHVQTQQQQQQ